MSKTHDWCFVASCLRGSGPSRTQVRVLHLDVDVPAGSLPARLRPSVGQAEIRRCFAAANSSSVSSPCARRSASFEISSATDGAATTGAAGAACWPKLGWGSEPLLDHLGRAVIHVSRPEQGAVARTLSCRSSIFPPLATEKPVTSEIFTRNACVRDIDGM